MSYCRQRLCWLVGQVCTQGLRQSFTHIHKLGLPPCCRSCCFPRHTIGCLPALHVSREGVSLLFSHLHSFLLEQSHRATMPWDA